MLQLQTPQQPAAPPRAPESTRRPRGLALETGTIFQIRAERPKERGDPVLDRWWSPNALAERWGCDPKTARARLRRLNARCGGRLFDPADRAPRILGRTLEHEYPGALGGDSGVPVNEVRQVAAGLGDVEAWMGEIDEWRSRVTKEIDSLRRDL